jgi:hypothetical protein
MITPVGARPLDVRPEVPLTAAQLAAFERLASYDLAAIAERLLVNRVLPAEWVDEAIYEFRRFLGLSIVVDERMPMCSPAVDEAWHTCILFTRLYTDLCAQTVGYYVHHEPGTWQDQHGVEAYGTFKRAYNYLYGETTRMWRLPVLWWLPQMALRRRDEPAPPRQAPAPADAAAAPPPGRAQE